MKKRINNLKSKAEKSKSFISAIINNDDLEVVLPASKQENTNLSDNSIQNIAGSTPHIFSSVQNKSNNIYNRNFSDLEMQSDISRASSKTLSKLETKESISSIEGILAFVSSGMQSIINTEEHLNKQSQDHLQIFRGSDIEDDPQYKELTSLLYHLKNLPLKDAGIKELIISTQRKLDALQKCWKPRIDIQKYCTLSKDGKSIETMLMKNKYTSRVYLTNLVSLDTFNHS